MLEIKELPARTLLGLSRPFISASNPNTNAPQVIGPLWGEMSKKFFGMKLLRSDYPVGVGAMWRDVEFETDGSMIYFAGYEVDVIPEDLDGLEVLVIDAGRYALVEHSGPMDQLSSVITNFYTKLLPESNLERRVGMDLEIYHENENPELPPRVVIAAPLEG
jgi:predicted transcriptional regulator YdeE